MQNSILNMSSWLENIDKDLDIIFNILEPSFKHEMFEICNSIWNIKI